METIKTLADLRRASGLTIAAVIARSVQIDHRFPRSHEGLLKIEQRGTRDYWKIHALAATYGLTPAEIAAICSPRYVANNAEIM